MRSIIIIISILVVTATIGTIAVGTRIFDGVVVENPYETGLAWDETRQNKAALGWGLKLKNDLFKTGKNELALEVHDRNGRQLENAAVRVTLSRPSTRAYDKTYPAVKTVDGTFRVDVDFPLFGSWDLKVDVSRDKDYCSFISRIYAEQQKF